MSYSWESDLGVDLKGQVVSGRPLAAAEPLTLREQVQTIIREPLCAGSLNIVLNRSVRLHDAARLAFYFDYRTLWGTSLGGMKVWVYRGCESPLHIVKILSRVHLRERLNLKNGPVRQGIGCNSGAADRQIAIILHILKEIVAMCRRPLSMSSPKNGLLPRED